MNQLTVNTSPGTSEFRWLLVAAIFALFVYQERHRVTWPRLARELTIVTSAYFLYFGVRGITEGSPGPALDHAEDLMEFERNTGLLLETDLQRLIIDHDWMVNVANWVYIWGHWPVIVATATWLYLHHPRTYANTRNAFLVSGGIGLLIFAAYPVAPPRLADAGLVDTITLHSHAYRVLQPPALVNQYAALPSLHFGWNLLIALAVFRCAGSPVVRAIALVSPVLMFAAVIMTGNHYIVDPLAGCALALAALVLVAWMRERNTGEESEPVEVGAAQPQR